MNHAFQNAHEQSALAKTNQHWNPIAPLRSGISGAAVLAMTVLFPAWIPPVQASEKTGVSHPPKTAEMRHSTPGDVVRAFALYFNGGRHEQLLGLYDPKAVFVPAPGKMANTPEGIRNATAQFMGMRVPIRILVRHVYESGDLALVVSDWRIEGKTPGGDPVELAGTATDVLRKSPSKGWMYLIDNPFGGQQPQQ
jgi:ketosteroid isomerase-like protein